MKDELLTAASAAKRLAVSRSVIAKWCSGGFVRHYKVGPLQVDALGRDRRAVRIPESEVQRLALEIPRTE